MKFNSKLKASLISLSVVSGLLLSGCGVQDLAETDNTPKNEVSQDSVSTEEVSDKKVESGKDDTAKNNLIKADTSKHKLIKVDGGDTSGTRQANVVVDVGFGDREYWAYTNEHGQLVRVTAAKIILQDDSKEPVKNGRYYSAMANVPGVGEKYDNDRGHVIADSLGGVSNAYNITPQNSTLNRHGDQAYMEKTIRDAGGATDFEAIITYPNNETQIPSKYKVSYKVKGYKVVDEFENGNPDKKNKNLGLTGTTTTKTEKFDNATETSSEEGTKQTSSEQKTATTSEDLSKVDTNGNGKVTIQEAKDAGYSMPITRDHWLYKYMDDRNGDGIVGN